MTDHVTANGLLTRLTEGADRPVLFRTPDYEVRPGYHLAEFKLAWVRSVDCGRGAHEWNEAVIELLDGSRNDDEHMQAGKMAAILSSVIAELPQIGEAELVFEFGNDRLSRYRVNDVDTGADRSVISLAPIRGKCKAAEQLTCCTPSATAPPNRSCCSTGHSC